MILEPEEIAVWRVPLVGEGQAAWLSPDEQAFAASAVDPELRRRRVRARSALRTILGGYLQASAETLVLTVGEHGKPRLPDGPAFNLSHARELMLVAVSGVGEVGVDLEPEGRRDADWRALGPRVFSPAEQAEIAALPPADQGAACLRAWVRKEAYAKARGSGFAYGFQSFTVRTIVGGGESLLADDANDPDAVSRWRLVDLAAPEGFVASLAHAGRTAAIRYRDIEELRS